VLTDGPSITPRSGIPAQELPRPGLAIVGAGAWGSQLLRYANDNGELDVRYVCDIDLSRARQVAGACATAVAADSFERVVADPAVRAVCVATPAATHADLVAAALLGGKHVLVETPLASSLGDGAALVRAAAQRGLTLMLDHTSCYSPAVDRLHELLQTGDLGQLHYFDSIRMNLGPVQTDVDVLWDLAPHDIAVLDLLQPSNAHPVAVAAHGADPLGIGRASVGYLSLRLANGGIAHVHVNWLSPTRICTVMVGGSQRTAVWNDVDPRQKLSIYHRGIDLARSSLGPGQKALHAVYRTGDMVAPALRDRHPLQSVIESFVAAVAYGKPVLTDGHAGLRVLAILEAARVSMQEGGAFVPLDLTIDSLTPRRR
jgi:predicted dehydrogenase